MKKFDERNVIKKKIHKKKTTIIIETKEIWFVDL